MRDVRPNPPFVSPVCGAFGPNLAQLCGDVLRAQENKIKEEGLKKGDDDRSSYLPQKN